MLRAIDGDSGDRVPIWFMRQAGRYLPEYNQVRSGMTFLELCRNVNSAVEVSLQPLRRFGVDGVIMFSDILTPLAGAGIKLRFEEARGPVFETTISDASGLSLLDRFDPERDCGFVAEIIGRLKKTLTEGYSESERPTLLGFAGAPFTLASYLIEGKTSRKFELTKKAVFGDSDFFKKLCDRLADMTIDYLSMQIQSGADVVQIFDSWGGILSGEDYAEYSAPFIKKISDALKARFPETRIIVFTGTGSHLLEQIAGIEPHVVSLDWRVVPAEVHSRIPAGIALQGNMDPLVLYGNPGIVRDRTLRALRTYSHRKNYIFNLGHGIHPSSPMECVEAMVKTVQEFRR